MDELTPLFNTEDDLFNFESDHLALKGNKDYYEVLKTLVILAAQRERALKDYKKVTEMRLDALENPFATLEKIQNGVDLGVPPLFELPKLPTIDFQKYNVKIPEDEIKSIYTDTFQQSDEKTEIKNTNLNNNKAWSIEEQKKLEELLHVYPPEPVEMKRFQKIAKALGNRTVSQVSSRVQKYFLKLYKAGLPVPGRIPKAGEKYKKSALHKHQRHNHYLWKPSTFFPSLNVPVQMEDLNDIPGPSSMPSPTPFSTSTGSSADTSSDNYLLRTDYHQNSSFNTNLSQNMLKTEAEIQINLLKRIREEKAKENIEGYVPFTHMGYRCDYCDEDPIVGTRWHCTTCPDSMDFCTDCVLSQMYSENAHPLNHWLAMYEDDSERDLLPPDFYGASGSKRFDRQISEELRNEVLCTNSDDDGFSE